MPGSVTGSAAPAPWRHLTALDGLRGVAILLVVAGHIWDTDYGYGGPIGVSLFFVLSGYLITSLLLAEHERDGSIHLPSFYARRALRLLPALLVFVVLMPAVMKAVGDPRLHTDYLQLVPFTLTYSVNYVLTLGRGVGLLEHTWSLSLEEQFYLVWPALLLGLIWLCRRDRTRLAWAVGLLTAAGIAWHVIGAVRWGLYRAYFGSDTTAYALLLGALIAVLPKPRVKLPAWAAPAFVLMLALASAHARGVIWHQDLAIWYETLACFLGAVLIYAALDEPRLLTNRVLVFFGDISYSLYLWHFSLILLWPHNHPMNHYGRFVAACAAVVLATLSTKLVEEPALRLKRRLARVSEASVAAGSVPGELPTAARPRRPWLAAVGMASLLLPLTGILVRVAAPERLPQVTRAFLQYAAYRKAQLREIDHIAKLSGATIHTIGAHSGSFPVSQPVTLPAVTRVGCVKASDGSYQVIFSSPAGSSAPPSYSGHITRDGATDYWVVVRTDFATPFSVASVQLSPATTGCVK